MRLVASLLIALTGCGRYDDFTLPPKARSPGKALPDWRERPAPVMSFGSPGSWDYVDALNPSVLLHQGKFWNFYSGFDGKVWHTGVATSQDGIHWDKRGKILSPDPASWEGGYIAANGSALHVGEEWWYWYQAGDPPRIGLARSRDGLHWEKLPASVLETGPRGGWDERGVADPYVVRIGGWYYMYFLGQDRARRQRLGLARSRDGVEWWKLRANPILELGELGSFDELGLGEPAIWESQDRYWMLYTGRSVGERRRMSLAQSRDGVNWERVPIVIAGSRPWNHAVVCDATVLVEREQLRIWFGGGDVPHPAENIHGQIGYAELRIRSQ